MAITDDLRVRRVLLAAEAISGDRDKAVAWLQEPIATFGGKTALELVAEQRETKGSEHFSGPALRSNSRSAAKFGFNRFLKAVSAQSFLLL